MKYTDDAQIALKFFLRIPHEIGTNVNVMRIIELEQKKSDFHVLTKQQEEQ